jgi:hypothetical protein
MKKTRMMKRRFSHAAPAAKKGPAGRAEAHQNGDFSGKEIVEPGAARPLH